MKINDAEVQWNIGWANAAELILHVEGMAKGDQFRYEHKDGCYYAEKDGEVSFFDYTKPGNGFGGRTFPITMADGTKVELKGPWSSRAGAMNHVGFGPCVDVIFIEKETGYRLSGAVTLKAAEQAAAMAGVTLHETRPYGPDDDIVWAIKEPKPKK